MKATKIEIGDSLIEPDQIPVAKKFIETCEKEKVQLFFPKDLVIANDFTPDALSKIISTENGIEKGWRGMDIGPETIALWSKQLEKGKTIFWNGPLGVFEFPKFAKGTQEMAQAIASIKNCASIVGGGDSLAAIHQMDLSKEFSYLSTSGGATLEFIEFGTLPGLEALSEKLVLH